MDLIWEVGCSRKERRSECGNRGRSALELLHVLRQDEQWERDDQVSQRPAWLVQGRAQMQQELDTEWPAREDEEGLCVESPSPGGLCQDSPDQSEYVFPCVDYSSGQLVNQNWTPSAWG